MTDEPARHGGTRIFYHHHAKGEPCDNWCGTYPDAPQWHTASHAGG